MVGLQSGGGGGMEPCLSWGAIIHGADTPLHSLVHEKNYIGGIALKGELGGGLMKNRV